VLYIQLIDRLIWHALLRSCLTVTAFKSVKNKLQECTQHRMHESHLIACPELHECDGDLRSVSDGELVSFWCTRRTSAELDESQV
jgi:hypothetical protein